MARPLYQDAPERPLGQRLPVQVPRRPPHFELRPLVPRRRPCRRWRRQWRRYRQLALSEARRAMQINQIQHPRSLRGSQAECARRPSTRYGVIEDPCKVQRGRAHSGLVAALPRCAVSSPGILHRARRGFTLIEMMVVMVLIGIVTAVIIPEMRGTYEDALLRSTSRELVNAFNLAYSRAVTLNQIHRVRLMEVSGRYVTEARTSGSHGADEFLALPDSPGTQGELDTRISVAIHRPDSSSEPGGEANPSAAGDALPAP